VDVIQYIAPISTHCDPSMSVASSQVEQQFQLTPSDFERIRRLIYARAGISLHEGKQAMVYSRLSRRLRELRHPNFASYLDALERGTGAAGEEEWQEFVNSLTTNLTSFFREEHHFHALHEELSAKRGRPIRIWCNAASTGEEPYSIAMIASEALGSAISQVTLLCTDIDTKVLQKAQRGVYDAECKGLSMDRLKRHFLKGTGNNQGSIRVKPELAKLPQFRVFNLMSPQWSGLGEAFDIVFCRNVMIYFDNETQRKVLEKIHAAMKPKGTLYVGHSENFTDCRDLFVLRGKTVYERV
jgi:chemotaxis protein methyltransferase CheR